VVTLTPEEWAEEQLRNAPQRSAEWARQVARIWGLEISESDSGGDDKETQET
jgi:hypothetical protein